MFIGLFPFITSISIHTTARVVTLFVWMRSAYFSYFNPHHRTGGDPLRPKIMRMQFHISIHTTARVVTVYMAQETGGTRDFNPHHRTGGDWEHQVSIMIPTDFNPHHRTGGDYGVQSVTQMCGPISIHTTARVVTFM